MNTYHDIDAGARDLARHTRRALVALVVLAVAFGVLLQGGCVSTKSVTPPVDDRIGSLKEQTDEQNKAIDAASASNTDTLGYIRQAREYFRKLIPSK